MSQRQKKFSKSNKILKIHNFKIFKIDTKIKNYSIKEAQIINKFNGKLVIIDRLGKVNMKFINYGLKNFEKKIVFDDSSNYRKHFNISFNPLIKNVKKIKNNFVGLKYFISPIYFYRKKRIKSKKNGVFIFFGNYDKNNILKKIFIKKEYNPNIVFYLPRLIRNLSNLLKLKIRYIFLMSKIFTIICKNPNL